VSEQAAEKEEKQIRTHSDGTLATARLPHTTWTLQPIPAKWNWKDGRLFFIYLLVQLLHCQVVLNKSVIKAIHDIKSMTNVCEIFGEGGR